MAPTDETALNPEVMAPTEETSHKSKVMAPTNETALKSAGGGGRNQLTTKDISAALNSAVMAPTNKTSHKPQVMAPTDETALKSTGGGCKQLTMKAISAALKAPRKQSATNRSTNKIRIFVKSAHRIPFPLVNPLEEVSLDLRHFVCLVVEPTLTISALKKMLKPYHWIPEDNLVLVSEDGQTPLTEDSYTIAQCGVRDQDVLFACMDDGGFTFYIYSKLRLGKFPVPVRSCFQTVGDVKKEIFKLEGYDPKDQILTNYGDSTPLDDETPLVALGVVKPYLKEMEFQCPRLKLVAPLSRKRKHDGGTMTRGGTLIPTYDLCGQQGCDMKA